MAGNEPIFLARESYRRRRLGDAAKVVPLLGLILLLVPILWASESATSNAMIYIFTVWAVLIVSIGVLSRQLAKATSEEDSLDDAENPER